MQIPAGVLLDKYGSKKILVMATLLCAIGNIIFVLDGYTTAMLGRLLIGVGSSFAFIGVIKLIRENLDTKYFAILSSIVISLGTLAAAFSQQLSVFISSSNVSWIYVFIYSGVLGLPLALLFQLFLPKEKSIITIMPSYKDIFVLTKSLIKNKPIILNAIWAGLVYIPTVVLTSQYGTYFFKETHNIGALYATSLVTVIFVGWVIFSPIVATVANRVNLKLLVGVFVLGIIVTTIMMYLPSFENYLVEICFAFGAFSAVQVLVWYYFGEYCPKNISGLGIAFTNMIITLITELGQLAIGSSMDVASYFSFSISLMMVLGFILLSIIGYMFFIKTLRSKLGND